ncbi:breast cancer anti-estrogen resistance protein 1-like isoform X2 [Cyprinodon tularosa]|uniref:breast cancer anti-estrogen resistance protein 1-like isoform X2 n=1 Tax=Cyprinodon tularosa TaxID=77115 RepID=UPI0018E237E1|nr:breast cancer anti-estrogen resistance protein 1-like isoform X2 [Cyprinodon tularosa]
MSVPVLCRIFDCLQGAPQVENVLAKALYDNVAESPDELSFRKGDIMTVLERDTQGLDGWWLCSLHGRQGIVPGNRLKILVGMYDSKQQQVTATTPDPASSCSTPQLQRPHLPQSAYAQSTPAISTPSAPVYPTKPLSAAHYTPMHPPYSTPSPAQSNMDSVYMMPPSHGPKVSSQSLYQVPSGPSGSSTQIPPGPPKKTSALGQGPFEPSAQDIYQVPPSVGLNKATASAGGTATGQDVYQVPPSWESNTKPLGKVRKRKSVVSI